MTKNLLAVFSLVIALGATSARAADEVDLNEATLQCLLNKSVSLFLFQSTEKVYYKHFAKDAVAMDVSEFNTYRCPHCYSFKAKLGEAEYEGRTKGIFNQETRKWSIEFNLKVDGKAMPTSGCVAVEK